MIHIIWYSSSLAVYFIGSTTLYFIGSFWYSLSVLNRHVFHSRLNMIDSSTRIDNVESQPGYDINPISAEFLKID